MLSRKGAKQPGSPGRNNWWREGGSLVWSLTWETGKQRPELLLGPGEVGHFPLQQSSLLWEEVLSGPAGPEDCPVGLAQLPLRRLLTPQQLHRLAAEDLGQLLDLLSEGEDFSGVSEPGQGRERSESHRHLGFVVLVQEGAWVFLVQQLRLRLGVTLAFKVYVLYDLHAQKKVLCVLMAY